MEGEDYGGQGYYSDEANTQKQIHSLVEVLTNSNKLLTVLRYEFRGEELIQKPDGANIWFQISKPLFVRTDVQTEKPLKIKVLHPNGKEGDELIEIYVPHDEAIEEILSLIKMCGMNQITPLGTTDEKEMNLDLFEFEQRLSILLTIKRKEWGIDKALRPMVFKKIKQQVQDARTLQVGGRVLKSLTQTVRHNENVNIGEKKSRSPYE